MILSITIVAILIMAVAVPIFSDATKPATQLNDCKYGAVQSSQDMTMTISWADGVTNFKTSTGEDMDLTPGSDTEGNYISIMADSVLVQVNYLTTGYRIAWAPTDGTSKMYTDSIKTTITLTLANGILAYKSSKISCEWVIYPSESGNLGCISNIGDSSTLGAWANRGQTMYWAYATFMGEAETVIGFGDPWDVTTITCKTSSWTGNPSSVTILEDGSRAKKFGALVFDDSTLTTYSDVHLVFAPLEYLPNSTSGGSSDQVNTLVDLIPMIMVAGLVTAVAASYVRKRMEE